MELAQVAQAGSVGLLGSALVLGIRHGIDWDHIAAISDITSTTTNVESADARASASRVRFGGHAHDAHAFRVDQYGPRAAFSVGLLHGIGAETGSQVLIIAAVGGAASQGLGTGMMLAFIVGLLISNSLIAVLTAGGFISSTRAKSVYVVVGALAGTFSLVVGAYFLLGASDALPSLEPLTASLGGGGG